MAVIYCRTSMVAICILQKCASFWIWIKSYIAISFYIYKAALCTD